MKAIFVIIAIHLVVFNGVAEQTRATPLPGELEAQKYRDPSWEEQQRYAQMELRVGHLESEYSTDHDGAILGIGSLTGGRREDFIRQMKEVFQEYSYDWKTDPRYVAFLTEASDPDASEASVRRYKSGDYDIVVNELVLPEIVDDAFNASLSGRVWGMGYSPRATAAKLVIGGIAYSKVFPEKTRNWAEGVWKSNNARDEMLWTSVAQEWWTHNKDAVLSKQYDKATWLPSAEVSPPSKATSPLEPHGKLENDAVRPLASPNAASSIRRSENSMWIKAGAGILALVGGVLIWWRRKKKA